MLNLICCNFECSVSYACCCLPGSKRNYQLEPETHWCYYRGTNPKKSLILIILLLLCFGWSVGGLYAPIDKALLVHNLFSLRLIMYAFSTCLYLAAWNHSLFRNYLGVSCVLFVLTFVGGVSANLIRTLKNYNFASQLYFFFVTDLGYPWVFFIAAACCVSSAQKIRGIRSVEHFKILVKNLFTIDKTLMGVVAILIEPTVFILDNLNAGAFSSLSLPSLCVLFVFPIVVVARCDYTKSLRECFSYYILFYTLNHAILLFSAVVSAVNAYCSFSEIILTCVQVPMMALLFVYMKLCAVVAKRMSAGSNIEHYRFVYAPILFKQVFWMTMYQACVSKHYMFALLLFSQTCATFIQCSGIDNTVFVTLVNEHLFKTQVIPSRDSESDWRRRLIEAFCTLVATLFSAFMIPIFISDLYHGTSFLNYNRAVGVNYISLSQHELFVQFIRVLLCMLFNIFAVGAAMFLILRRLKQLGAISPVIMLNKFFLENVVLFLLAELWILDVYW